MRKTPIDAEALHYTCRQNVLVAFSLLLGIPEEQCCGVFIAETPIDAEALHYTYRENALVAFSLLLGIPKSSAAAFSLRKTPISAEALHYTYRENALVAFSLLLGIPEEKYCGVFIAENAHRCGSPTLHLQGKCSNGFEETWGKDTDVSS
ncbi:hypothetical protein [Terriglobus albidus]|uniref:hypothetical protein n=1 Tax=Terriglobus albidus TaxID=1592106 RepID=UPI0021DF9A1A|nr:hypothetical protein [Terriglobus albidus]